MRVAKEPNYFVLNVAIGLNRAVTDLDHVHPTDYYYCYCYCYYYCYYYCCY